MNIVMLMGRITHDLELKTSANGGKYYLDFTMAVEDEVTKNKTHFIRCVAFGKTAEFISKYFGKGRMLAVQGNIAVDRYTNKEGKVVDAVKVLISKCWFTGEKKQGDSGNYATTPYPTAAGTAPAPTTAANVPPADYGNVSTDDDYPF